MKIEIQQLLNKCRKLTNMIGRRKKLIRDLQDQNKREDLRPEYKIRNESLIKQYRIEIGECTDQVVKLKIELFGLDENTAKEV